MRSKKVTGNVFVTNLPPGFNDARLAEMFDPFGLVLSAFVARDAQSGALRNQGLVDLAPADAVKRAIAELDGRAIDGQPVGVRVADPNLALRAPSRPTQRAVQATAEPGNGSASDYRPAPRPARKATFVVEHRTLGYRSRAT